MHQPEIYDLNNKPPREGTAMALRKYSHLIKWRGDNQDTVMDIGCGSGNVLLGLILPVIRGKFSIIYGTDLSEKMIEFCKKQYSGMENMKFIVMDILKDNSDFVNTYGQMDHVFSTYAIHWLPDQPKGFDNIFNLLKPGGDLFSVHLLSSPYFDILKHMDQNEKWSPYFDNLTQFVPFTQDSKQPEEDLRKVLENKGFTDVFTEVFNQEVLLDNYQQLLLFLKGVIGQIDRIPEERQMEYVKDFFRYGLKNGIFECKVSGEAIMSANVVILYAKRPELQ